MMNGTKRVLVLTIVALAIGAGAALAAPAATADLDASGIRWTAAEEYGSATLRVVGGDTVIERTFRAGEALELAPVDARGNALPDGTYSYEIVFAPAQPALRDRKAPAGGGEPTVEARIVSGTFTVAGGSLVDPRLEEGGAAAAPAGNRLATRDQVIPDDLIVQQSLCVGFDCVNGESFGFDTIRLKENNTRIKFEDTSTGTFPSTDWQLTANDSSSGGQNRFSIEDITSGRNPFTIEGGSTTNSIYVDSTGRVGFRTSTPVLDIHVNTSNTPGMRLEQNSSGGFSAQTWDIAGNETNFFIRDVTGGSRLPFRIRPGAPTSSIDISASGNVGIGTASPAAALHVKKSDGTAKLQVEETNGTATLRNMMTLTNNGGIQFLLDRTDGQNDWQVSNFGASFAVSVPGAATNQMVLTATGDMTISGTNYNVGSSRELKENFQPVDPHAILDRVVSLPMTEWSPKAAPELRHIGPVAEDWWAAFGLGSDDKHVGLTDVGGVALAAIKGLHEVVVEKEGVIAELEQRLATLQAQNGDLAARLAAIEAALNDQN